MIPVAAEGSALDTTPGTGKTGKAQRKIAVAAPLIRKHMPFFSSTRYPVCFLRRCRRMETGFISAVTADARR